MDIMEHNFAFVPDVRLAFAKYLRDYPNRRRVSEADKSSLIKWLVNTKTSPASQRESSRRHYVRKKFAWNHETKALEALAKGKSEKPRKVVIQAEIVDVIENVHGANGHAGWDATWKDVSGAYYGILRADVIFLLKRCHVCANNPRKRSKGFSLAMQQPETMAVGAPCSLHLDTLVCDKTATEKL
ncbi:hypothetical protein CDD81_1485 [Ophiocordyceps australis]|uniref:Integrase zinc-binding domain-containing protein n=1 Tax=Ophiocordyceps australis TaxID=1399860 RepID=A0A2C5XKJ2_9HYPO|nr:hypothetical protein CDD81_1485 [Ophiocordyceps australis]